jgi:hypothetical protein
MAQAKCFILKPKIELGYFVLRLYPNCTISWSRNWNHVYVLLCMLILRDSVWAACTRNSRMLRNVFSNILFHCRQPLPRILFSSCLQVQLILNGQSCGEMV